MIKQANASNARMAQYQELHGQKQKKEEKK